MDTRNSAQRALFWSGLALLAWPTYELVVRTDAMIGPLKMFVNMAVSEQIPLFRVLGYVDWGIFATPAFLLGSALLGVFSLCLRKRSRGCLMLLPFAFALGLYGYLRQGFLQPEPLRVLEALPFAGIIIGCALHCAGNIAENRRAKKRQRPKAFPLKHRTE